MQVTEAGVSIPMFLSAMMKATNNRFHESATKMKIYDVEYEEDNEEGKESDEITPVYATPEIFGCKLKRRNIGNNPFG